MNKNVFLPKDLLKTEVPSDVGTVFTSVKRIELKGKPCTIESRDEELCIVCIQGSFSFSIKGEKGTAQIKDMLYVPRNANLIVEGDNAVLMRFGAPCSRDTEFSHIRFEDVDKDERHKVFGKIETGTKRDVWNFIDEKFDSPRFLCGMCKGSDGGWTAWPPHKHADKREEVYIYFNMGDSFGAQFVYDDMDKPYTVTIVRDGTVVTIPKGYHPNVGSPSGGIFYVYIMVSLIAEDRNFMDLHIDSKYGTKLE